jgi:hypothetical protein
MEQEKVLMGQKQLQKWHLVKMVEVGMITLKEVSEKMGVVSEHQVFNLE